MKMMYRKPTIKIMDRHTLIELDGDFTDHEIGHLLNKAYLSHKAPHEYDELKKYIRDLVIGKHNSLYIMGNGSPDPLASATILASPYLVYYSGPVNYDYAFSGTSNTGVWNPACTTNNPTNCNTGVYAESSTAGCKPLNWEPIFIEYNNGEAWQWGVFYKVDAITDYTTSGLYTTMSPITGNVYPPDYVIINAKYGYAPYVSSTNPLTLTTYFYWSPGSSSYSFSYVYFTIAMNPYTCNGPNGGIYIIPLFYSTGQYNFNSDTYYISMWQFTYT